MFAAVVEHGITHVLSEELWSCAPEPRDFVDDPHRTIDDRPFGGGPGMVMMAQPLADALNAVKLDGGGARVIALAPNGVSLTDSRVRQLAQAGESLALVCGRYEGIDQRFIDVCVDDSFRSGDFLSCRVGACSDGADRSVVRQLPGALKTRPPQTSLCRGLLDAKHYSGLSSGVGLRFRKYCYRAPCADCRMAPGARRWL